MTYNYYALRGLHPKDGSGRKSHGGTPFEDKTEQVNVQYLICLSSKEEKLHMETHKTCLSYS